MYYPREIQVSPLTSVRRDRMLPVPGEIFVHPGDQVEPTQVIARANLPGDFRILPLARLLGVPGPRVQRYLRVGLGDVLQLLPRHVGPIKRYLHTDSKKVRQMISGHPAHSARKDAPTSGSFRIPHASAKDE